MSKARNWRSSFSGNQRSSASRKAIKVPFDFSIAVFLAFPGDRSAEKVFDATVTRCKRTNDVRGFISRAIVDDEQFPVRVSLIDDRLDRLTDKLLGVVRGHDHANEGCTVY